MKVKILLATIFYIVLSTASTGFAHARVPSGCFVTDEERLLYSPPPLCFNEERALIIPYTSNSFGQSSEGLYDFYGYQYGAHVLAFEGLFDDYTAAKNSSDTHYSWYLTEFNKNKRLSALEKKLRRACGSKCKKIK